MKPKDLNNLLIVLNSTNDLIGKYPIGNQDLTRTIKGLEASGKIKYDACINKWIKL